MAEYVYIGSYKDESGYGGISVFRWDKETERLTLCGTETCCRNPSYFVIHPAKNILYAANELHDCAEITAHKINPSHGVLEYINMARVSGFGMCHIAVAPSGAAIVAANYDSGDITACALEPCGKLGKELLIRSGVSPRQGAHMHQAEIDSSKKRMVSVDLGSDMLEVYGIDESGHLFKDNNLTVMLEKGQGPRRIRFHPSGEFAYVLTESGNRIFVCAYSNESGQLTITESYSLVPEEYAKPAYAAELMFSKDARFLFSSVRGYDSIVRFRVNECDGRLSEMKTFPCCGKYPRMFAFSGDGRHMFIANQKSGTVTVLRVDEQSKDLSEPCETVQVSNPCAVLPVIIS